MNFKSICPNRVEWVMIVIAVYLMVVFSVLGLSIYNYISPNKSVNRLLTVISLGQGSGIIILSNQECDDDDCLDPMAAVHWWLGKYYGMLGYTGRASIWLAGEIRKEGFWGNQAQAAVAETDSAKVKALPDSRVIIMTHGRRLLVDKSAFSPTDWDTKDTLSVTERLAQKFGVRITPEDSVFGILAQIAKADSVLARHPAKPGELLLAVLSKEGTIEVGRMGLVNQGRRDNNILRVKLPVRDHWGKSTSVRYTPYSAGLAKTNLHEIGDWYITALVATSFKQLREWGIESRAFPGGYIDDWLHYDIIKYLILVENGANGHEPSINKVLAQVGANMGDMGRYTCSPKQARGFFQFIYPTYRYIYEGYGLDAKMKPGYYRAMESHFDGCILAILLADNNLAALPESKRRLYRSDPAKMGQYLAIAYNAGAASMDRRLPDETKGYLVSFKGIWETRKKVQKSFALREEK